MYVNRNYGFLMTFRWSIKPFLIGLLYAGFICLLCFFLKVTIIIPWAPIGVVGVAVAFYLGFKNNSSYDRTWEARKIWGGIVNNSRGLGLANTAFVQGEKKDEIQKELVYRHLAWLTALRHQLRLSRSWEHVENRLNGLYSPTVCEDYTQKLEKELLQFIPKAELDLLTDKANLATQLMHNQSKRLQELKEQGYFGDFRHMEFHHLLVNLIENQGQAERIKNFPFPRQYASTALWLTVVFSAFVPFGLFEVFSTGPKWMFWLNPFFSALVIWVFFLMEKIGDYSENPFEGTYNDVPITSISRGIEIDLREMINDTEIPEPMKATNGFLM